MRRFKLLPHTADIRLYVEADSLSELFKGAISGMCEILKPGSSRSKVETRSKVIEVDSLDQTTLLIDFLSEVLTYIQEEGIIYTRAKILSLGENNLKAEIYGNPVSSFDEEIKGVTYHNAQIQKNERGNLEVTIVFDV